MNIFAKKTEKEQKLPAWVEDLQGSPILTRIQVEKAASLLSRRQNEAAAIETLKIDEANNIPPLRAEIDKAQAELTEAIAVQKAILERLNKARVAAMAEQARIDGEIRVHRGELLETCDIAIDAAIEFFMLKFDELRGPYAVNFNLIVGELNLFTEEKPLIMESNKGSLEASLKYCQRSIRELEGMKLLPSCPHERIKQLKEGIPAVDNLDTRDEMVIGRKIFPRQAIDPVNAMINRGSGR